MPSPPLSLIPISRSEAWQIFESNGHASFCFLIPGLAPERHRRMLMTENVGIISFGGSI